MSEMAPRLRKAALTAHIVLSIGWLGALAAFLALAAAGLASQDVQTVRAAYVASELITSFVIVPFALASLLTGIVQALGTPWGLFRHFWVLFKLLIIVTATFMLLMKTGPITYLASAAANTTLSGGELLGVRLSITAHAAGGLLVLLWAATLGMYKPRGMTRHGRKQQEQQARADEGQSGTPRWVKVQGSFILALVLLVIAMSTGLIGGGITHTGH